MRSIVFGLAALTAPASMEAEPDAPSPAEGVQTVDDAPQETAPGPPEPSQDAGRPVLDRVLPCGVRVLVARDDSLPVASVILALERGSEDDPADLPGLHHALAYQLLMGNRGAAPGAIQAMVQDAGGIAFLATGPAQVRFESLVPVTLLDELIIAEAQRLRAPTVTESLWKEALVSAKRDVPLRRTTSWTAASVAHGAPGLGHRPRLVPNVLAELDVQTVEAELARRARYEHATFVVVAPLPLEETLTKIEKAFAGLPERARSVPERTPSASADTVEEPKGSGNTFVWGIPADPGARLWADAWCEALSRQRRGKDEPKPNRVRCAFDDDPRRPSLSIRVRTPNDPRALLQSRFSRLTESGSRLLRGPRRRLEQALSAENATPLGLARRLAAAAPRSEAAPPQTSVEAITGVRALETFMPLEDILPLEGSVRIVAPSTEDAPPKAEVPATTVPSATEEGA